MVVDFNKKLAALAEAGRRDPQSGKPLARPDARPDNEQHFCFGFVISGSSTTEAQKTVFYGCFTGWHLINGTTAALDLDMESGSTIRLFHDGQKEFPDPLR